VPASVSLSSSNWEDLVIGFSPERYGDLLTSCRHTTSVDGSEIEAQMQASARGGA
jgi:hypothetical protein